MSEGQLVPDDIATAVVARIALMAWQEEAAEDALEGVAEAFGAYTGLPAQVALLQDGRKARLLAPIAYRQQDGTDWPIPVGSMLDGASIPRAFWTLIGGPFEGRYRDASIVHDHYCDVRSRPWRDVHRMFYEAMRCSGVSTAKAKVMYYAVYRFGPRWPDVEEMALESAASRPTQESLDEGEASTVVADAEAIFVHDLTLEEIETLADVRATEPSHDETTLEAPGARSALDRARRLVIAGGSGRRDDVDAVVREAALLPDFVLAHFERKRIRIVACRGSVTDFERRLRGVTPRGWEGTGKTWDVVPGTYLDRKRRVVIATIAENGVRVVPTSASRLHGSAALVIHESLHGYDYSRNHVVLADQGFLNARTADLARLGEYEKREGQAGLEETFAESGARFVVERDEMATDWTNLCDYWESAPGALETVAGAAPADDGAEPVRDGVLGMASFEEGAIVLDLRAEGPGGAIGHAMLRIERDDPAYEAVSAHLLGETESIVPVGPIPYRPMQ